MRTTKKWKGNNSMDQFRRLGFFDFLIILGSWTGLIAIVYVTGDNFLGLIAIASGYYLSKWMILRKDSEEE